MNEIMRMRVAQEYLSLLERLGEPKKARLEILKKYGASRSSVYEYLSEFRNRPKSGRLKPSQN